MDFPSHFFQALKQTKTEINSEVKSREKIRVGVARGQFNGAGHYKAQHYFYTA